MARISLTEAREAFEGKRYSKEPARQICSSGYNFSVESRTGTIARIKPDGMPKGALDKLLKEKV